MSVSAVNNAASAAASLASGGRASALRNLPQSEQVKAAAGQFEAIILRQLLEDSVGKLTGGEKSGMYGYMMTDVLANKLTEGGGLGLAKVFEQQLSPRTSKATAALAAKENK
ncbi:MAG: rod-binding protein [Oleiharenicola lentus]